LVEVKRGDRPSQRRERRERRVNFRVVKGGKRGVKGKCDIIYSEGSWRGERREQHITEHIAANHEVNGQRGSLPVLIEVYKPHLLSSIR
jgi:hypothetical protein